MSIKEFVISKINNLQIIKFLHNTNVSYESKYSYLLLPLLTELNLLSITRQMY